MSDAAEAKAPELEAPESEAPESEADAVRAKRRGRNLALLAVLVAFVLTVYIVTIVKFELAAG